MREPGFFRSLFQVPSTKREEEFPIEPAVLVPRSAITIRETVVFVQCNNRKPCSIAAISSGPAHPRFPWQSRWIASILVLRRRQKLTPRQRSVQPQDSLVYPRVSPDSIRQPFRGTKRFVASVKAT